MAFLKAEPQRYVGKRLLHVGSATLSADEFAADLAQYVGIRSAFRNRAVREEVCRR